LQQALFLSASLIEDRSFISFLVMNGGVSKAQTRGSRLQLSKRKSKKKR
jgi:hypothetical protein